MMSQVYSDYRLSMRIFPLRGEDEEQSGEQLFQDAEQKLGQVEGCICHMLYSKLERLARYRKMAPCAVVQELESKARGFFVTPRQMLDWLDEMLAACRDQPVEQQDSNDLQQALGNRNTRFLSNTLDFQREALRSLRLLVGGQSTHQIGA